MFGTLKRTLRNAVGYFPEIHLLLCSSPFPLKPVCVSVELLFFAIKATNLFFINYSEVFETADRRDTDLQF